jgi:CDP-diacylglycerol pyrophosphatase
LNALQTATVATVVFREVLRVAIRIAQILPPAASLLLAVLAASAPGIALGQAPDEALWRIVDAGCRAQAPAPRPGLRCDLARRYAVLKDRCGPTHFLVLPLERRRGIESEELLRDDEPDYLALAWSERGRSLEALAAAGADDPSTGADVALAVNSRFGRSQSQLHVHIDFLRPQVRTALARLPRPLPAGTVLELLGHRYRVDALATLEGRPFAQLAQEWQAANPDERERLTVAVTGDGAGGYFMLSDRADLLALDRGHAEELLIERHCP